MIEQIKKVSELILKAKKVVALTGAGISAESGIPPFRGTKDSLWEKYNPEEYATIDAFLLHPSKVWKMLKEMGETLLKAKPNPAHYALAELEQMGHLSSVITQNIDGLHQAAGSKMVIEFHGNMQTLTCLKCKKKYNSNKISLEKIPPLCSDCKTVLKPDVVLFGEMIPIQAIKESQEEATTCDLMLVIGTSGLVTPAANIPIIAKKCKANIVEINLEKTPLTDYISDYILLGKCGEILPEIVKEVKNKQ